MKNIVQDVILIFLIVQEQQLVVVILFHIEYLSKLNWGNFNKALVEVEAVAKSI